MFIENLTCETIDIFDVKTSESKTCSCSSRIKATDHILMKILKSTLENMENLAPDMPSLDFVQEEFPHLMNGDLINKLTIDATDEAFLR